MFSRIQSKYLYCGDQLEKTVAKKFQSLYIYVQELGPPTLELHQVLLVVDVYEAVRNPFY